MKLYPAILPELKEHGFIKISSWAQSIEDFSKLISASSVRVSTDPARQYMAAGAQLVDAGTKAIGLHLENGYGPYLPHLCWFYCELAPKFGSSTTYCDGHDVWNAAPANIKTKLLEDPVHCTQRWTQEQWKYYLAVEHNKNEEDVTKEDLLLVEQRVPGQKFVFHDDGSVTSKREFSLARKSFISGKMAIANSLFGPATNYDPPVFSWKSTGKPIEQGFRDELHSLCDQFTKDIAWQPNDIVALDNTRVMHGRREITDEKNRRLFNGLSYLVA